MANTDKGMTAEKYYEESRKLGLTNKITSNSTPDYSLGFYQQIFQLMYDFAILKSSGLVEQAESLRKENDELMQDKNDYFSLWKESSKTIDRINDELNKSNGILLSKIRHLKVEIAKLKKGVDLPADEEIEKEFKKQGIVNDYVRGKIVGAKWMRDEAGNKTNV